MGGSWRVFQDFEICQKMKFAEGGGRENIAWTCVLFFTIFHNNLRASCGRPQLCSATFCPDLLLQFLNPYHIISTVTALHAAAQLGVACRIFLCPA